MSGQYRDARKMAYAEHKYNARRRGIPWGFTFEEWWAVWESSGFWSQRGRGKYVMARRGDAGPYSAANVEIITSSKNISDAHKNGRVPRQMRGPNYAALGRGRGWTYLDGDQRPYQVTVRSRYIGCFATEAEAAAAYHGACAALRLFCAQLEQGRAA